MDTSLIIENLAREGKLQEARRAGEEALAADPLDDRVLSALVSVYLEIESMCITNKVTCYLDDIAQRLDQLLAMVNDGEKSRTRHRQLLMKMQPGYEILSDLESLSARDGQEQAAYEAAHKLLLQGKLPPQLYEIYGTIIYRYARVLISQPTSRKVKVLLNEYLSLPLPRPSRLHSLILRLAVRCSRKFPDFKFVRFFALWDPALFRNDDLIHADNSNSSLAATAFELVIDSESPHELPELLGRVKAPPSQLMAIVREAFDNMVIRSIKDGDLQHAIDLLTLYSRHRSLHAPDARHSHLLTLALRIMDNDEMWRFVQFFVDWNPAYFTKSDYLPVSRTDGGSSQPLVHRALNRCFAALKKDVKRHEHLIGRVIEAYDSTMKNAPTPPDELSMRRRAMMLSWLERDNEAIERMCHMARKGQHSPDFWLDFASIVADKSCKAGLLAIALLECENSDDSRDIANIRLSLAQLLHHQGNDDGAITELEACRQVAEPMARYGAIKSTISPNAKPNYSNELLYHHLAAEALALIYNNVPTETMSAISHIDNIILLGSSDQPTVMVDTVIWPIARNIAPGDNLQIKREGTQLVMVNPIPGTRPYQAMHHRYGIITDNDKIQCTGRPEPVEADGPTPPHGTTVSAALYLDAEYRFRATNIRQAPRSEALDRFDHMIAAVYSATDEKTLLSGGVNGPWLEVNPNLCNDNRLGAIHRATFYLDSRGRSHVIAIVPLPDETPCEAIISQSGRLEVNDGQATVRDITVPSHILANSNIPSMTMVNCKTVASPHGPIALSIEIYD
ncbi:MAG: hypothetical protein NC082_02855 [Clostridiales bacterium]|nr:hypothetical protein [Clostridiales bacterium]